MEFIVELENNALVIGALGSIVGTIVYTNFGAYLKGIYVKLTNDPYSGYYGSYYTYKYRWESKRNDPDIYPKKLTIKNTPFGIKPKLYSDAPEYKLSGEMEISGGNIYFSFEGVEYREKLLEIYVHPLKPEQFDQKLGVVCGISPLREPVSGYRLISRNELSEKEVRDKLGIPKFLIVPTK